MTDASPPPAWAKFRMPALAAAGVFAVVAACVAWLTVGDTGGCAPDAPAAFSHLYRISSVTMEPAIRQGDWLWAERRAYCARDPERGDLVVLALASHPGTVFVKRVIGLPGDRVQLKQAELYLNGEPVRHDWIESAIHAGETGEASQRARFMETLNDRRYAVEIADPEAPLENTEEITVPARQYFVLGDNRDHSLDSRTAAEFGLVPRASIADRPTMVIWSADKSRIGLSLGAGP